MDWWKIALISAEVLVLIAVSVLYFRYKRLLKLAENTENTELLEKKSGPYIKWFIILTVLCIVFAAALVILSALITPVA